MNDEPTAMEAIREAAQYYTRNPIDLLGDVAALVGMICMFWVLLLIGG